MKSKTGHTAMKNTMKNQALAGQVVISNVQVDTTTNTRPSRQPTNIKVATTTTDQEATTTESMLGQAASKLFLSMTCPPSGHDVKARECHGEGSSSSRTCKLSPLVKTNGTNKPAWKESMYKSMEDGGDVFLHHCTYLFIDFWLLPGCSFDVRVIPFFR